MSDEIAYLSLYCGKWRKSRPVTLTLIVSAQGHDWRITWVYNKYTKPPECVDIIRHTSIFTAGALEARVRRTSAFRAPAGKTSDYINTRG